MGLSTWLRAGSFTAFGLFLGITIANVMWSAHFSPGSDAAAKRSVSLMKQQLNHDVSVAEETPVAVVSRLDPLIEKGNRLQTELDIADTKIYDQDAEIKDLKRVIEEVGQELKDSKLVLEMAKQEQALSQPTPECDDKETAEDADLIQTMIKKQHHDTDLSQATSWNDGPIPVWVWMDYKTLPGFIELNLRALLKNAPEPDFKVHYVNKDNILDWVPDMPDEFVRMPYAAATSDLIRTALIANHGGVYLDTDFVVTRPLHEFTDWLEEFDFVSYTSHGQDCADAQFSSNFVAGRKGNLLYANTWAKIKESLKQKCMFNDGDSEQGVCCYTSTGEPRKCHVPWAGVGERMSHPILQDLLNDEVNNEFQLYCLNNAESFVPVLYNSKKVPMEYKLDSGHIAWTEMDGDVCTRVGDDLDCSSVTETGVRWQANSTAYFSRLAYHLFSSIMSNKKKGTDGPTVPYKKLTASELLAGNWAISELYRKAFDGDIPPALIGIEEIVSQYEPIELEAVAPKSWPTKPSTVTKPKPKTRTKTSTGTKTKTKTKTKGKSGRTAAVSLPLSRGECSSTFSEWANQPMNKSDDFQCAPLNLSFVHIPKSAGTTIESIGKKMGITWGHDYDEKRWNLIKTLEETDPDRAASFPAVSSTHPNINTCRTGCYCGKGCCWWHIPPRWLQDWRPYYSSPLKFCVVRNPFGRMLSQYSYSGVWKCPNTTALLDQRDDYIRSNILNFRDKNWTSQADCHFIPQHQFVSSHIDSSWMETMWESEQQLSPVDAISHIMSGSSDLSPEDGRSCNIVLRFEHLADDLNSLSDWTDINVRTKWKKPYSDKCTKALRQETVDLIKEVFAQDFVKFGYDLNWPVYDDNTLLN